MRLQNPSGSGLAIGEADNRYLRLSGGTMTGELSALAGLNTTRPYSSGLVPQDSSDPLPAFPFVTEFNNAGKNWNALRVSVTDTASGSGSKIADFQVDGVSKFSISKTGSVQLGTFGASGKFLTVYGDVEIYRSSPTALGSAFGHFYAGSSGFQLAATLPFGWHDGSGATVSMDTGIQRDAAGVVKFTDGAGSLRDWKARRGSLSEYLDITEMSAPAAPAANTARLYVEDNGSGKTRLMVLFPTGAAQVLATEP